MPTSRKLMIVEVALGLLICAVLLLALALTDAVDPRWLRPLLLTFATVCAVAGLRVWMQSGNRLFAVGMILAAVIPAALSVAICTVRDSRKNSDG
jgi:protein-S-isoprenylcysteine O-methyltransferase Ste14